jgi:GNAT superfamily N-acetyltransferase
MGILAEASAALVQRGIHQWPSPPPPALWRLLEEQIALGQVYLARLTDTGLLAGTLRFTWEQPAVWPENPGEAGYVHSLAIRPVLQGRQLGKALLAWAAGHVRARPGSCGSIAWPPASRCGATMRGLDLSRAGWSKSTAIDWPATNLTCSSSSHQLESPNVPKNLLAFHARGAPVVGRGAGLARANAARDRGRRLGYG